MFFFSMCACLYPKAGLHLINRPILRFTSAVVPTLIVVFKCGHCPKGIGALVRYLKANEINFFGRFVIEKIFRNQVTFQGHPLDTVVLSIYSTHISITVCYNRESKKRTFHCPLKDVCFAIYEAVEMGIKQVTADINYVDTNAQ